MKLQKSLLITLTFFIVSLCFLINGIKPSRAQSLGGSGGIGGGGFELPPGNPPPPEGTHAEDTGVIAHACDTGGGCHYDPSKGFVPNNPGPGNVCSGGCIPVANVPDIGNLPTVSASPPQPTASACGVPCIQSSDCASARDGCVACLPNGSGQTVCAAPPPSPTPACGLLCVRNSDCGSGDALKNGCTSCLPNASGQNVCSPNVACGSSCVRDSDCNSGSAKANGCVSCINNTCKTPPACGVSCTKDADCAGARDGCISCIGGSCKAPPPVCGANCTKDADCSGAKDAQGNACSSCLPNASGQTVCQANVACGSSCVRDSDCNSGDALKNGCTSCLANSSGQSVCSPPPACGTTCAKDSDCAGARDGCNVCINNSCQTFNQDMCKCDGIDSTPIVSGQSVTVTNFEKVLAADSLLAKVKDMTFYLTKGDEILSKSDKIPAVVDSTDSTRVRYKASWTVTIPANLEQGVEYRLFAQTTCVKNSSLSFAPSKTDVLAAETQNQNFFARIAHFFSSIFSFGGNSQSSSPTATPSPSPVPSTSGLPQLQMGTFSPAVVTENSCRILGFHFR